MRAMVFGCRHAFSRRVSSGSVTAGGFQIADCRLQMWPGPWVRSRHGPERRAPSPSIQNPALSTPWADGSRLPLKIHPPDRLGHAGGLGLALDLDGLVVDALDGVRGDVVDAQEGRARADALADAGGGDEADLVQAVVHAHL